MRFATSGPKTNYRAALGYRPVAQAEKGAGSLFPPLLDYEFEQDYIGSDLSISGDSPVTCEQQVNQAAAAG